MTTRVAVMWLPTEECWGDFVAQHGVDGEPEKDSTRVVTHAGAVDLCVELLTEQGFGLLILSNPAVAEKAAPDADLSTQVGRRAAAIAIAEGKNRLSLGMSLTPDGHGGMGLGWALCEEKLPPDLIEVERRGNVRILTA